MTVQTKARRRAAARPSIMPAQRTPGAGQHRAPVRRPAPNRAFARVVTDPGELTPARVLLVAAATLGIAVVVWVLGGRV